MAVTYSFHNHAPVTGRYTTATWPEAGDHDEVLILDMEMTQLYGVHGGVVLRCHNGEHPDLVARAYLSAVLDGEVWFTLREEFHPEVQLPADPTPPSGPATPPSWIVPRGMWL